MIVSFSFFAFVTGQLTIGQNSSVKNESSQTPPSANPGRPGLTSPDVEAFLDGILPLQLAREDIAGATVVIVKDGKILFAKGYGFADIKEKKPVSTELTLFRPGSISKLFTWTAVMQLSEQGKLDLDRDVNEYLDFKIPDAFGKPITLKNIMAHTPGFEEQIKDLFGGEKSPNLGDYVRNHIPNRIYPPGTVPAYSNYGTALAGYIIERVSGQTFEDYISQHIFKPLGMNSSSFAQPLPADLAPNMSQGYLVGSDESKPFEIIGPYPAGSLSSTATDMSKFMLAHLQEGRLGEAQILKPETAHLMHSRLFGLDDAANAMAYGFYEESRNGHRIIGHGGDTVSFHSDLHLIPDAGVGFFVSYNSAGRGQISGRTILWDAFLNRYFPTEPSNLPTLENAKNGATAVAGTYLISRRSEGSFLRIAALLGQAKVSPNEDGTISVDAFNDPNDKPKRWREVAPMTFRDVNGEDSIVFKPDNTGRMQMIIAYPFMMFQRVGFLDNGKLVLTAAGLSLFVMVLTLILWFVGWLVRRHYGAKLELTTREKQLRYLVRLFFALDLAFVVALGVIVSYMSSNLDFFSDRGNNWVRVAQVIGLLGVIGTPIIFYNAIHAWISGRYRIWGKLQATIFALASLGFLWLVYAGNLLSFTSRF